MFWVFEDKKSKPLKNVRIGGFKSLNRAIDKATKIGDSHVTNESHQYVAIVIAGVVRFKSPKYFVK